MTARKTKKPRLFIVSSKEAKELAGVVQKGLKSVSDVTVWWSEELWTPGQTTLDVLLRNASVFDYAVAIFRADDLIVSRGEESSTPRDNVLFEAGLFMAHLGPERTFVVVPQEPKVKILSDLAGVNLLNYPKPTAASGFQGALKKTLRAIKKAIRQHELDKPLPPYAALCGPAGFNDTLTHAGQFLERARRRGKPIAVSNLALDMEHTWGVLRDNVLRHPWPAGLTCRSLIIDGESEILAAEIGDAVTSETARDREKALVTWLRRNADKLPGRKITFECRAYSSLPLLHGILFNQEELFFSFLSYHEAGVSGIGYCHVHAAPEDRRLRKEFGVDYIEAFERWFRKLWDGARPVWPAAGQAAPPKTGGMKGR